MSEKSLEKSFERTKTVYYFVRKGASEALTKKGCDLLIFLNCSYDCNISDSMSQRLTLKMKLCLSDDVESYRPSLCKHEMFDCSILRLGC